MTRNSNGLDGLLESAAPRTSTPSLARDAAIAAMVSGSRRGAGAATRVARVATVAVLSTATLGLGGMAAADAIGWDAPWSDEALNELTYTLPSGEQCSRIIGNFRGSDDVAAAATAFLSQDNLLASLDVEAKLEQLAAEPDQNYLSEDGGTSPAGPGTPYWDEDRMYSIAVDLTVMDALVDELTAEGLTAADFSWESELRCGSDAQG